MFFVILSPNSVGLNLYFMHREIARNDLDCSLNFLTVSNVNSKSLFPPKLVIQPKPLEKSTQVQI